MKIVFISDTHNSHEQLEIPACDLLIHGGDWSRHGVDTETNAFFDWFSQQPAREKILVAGNHDRFAEQEPEIMVELSKQHRVHWLLDSGLELCGLRFWGSPFTPRHHDWAFQEERGAAIQAHWDKFPEGLDILVTHGPPFGILDYTIKHINVGCEALLEAVQARPPKIHLFGHVHEDYGETRWAGMETRFINGSSFLSTKVRKPITEAVRPPLVLEL
jgi:Icc-related predicted phosphoesterase